MRKIKTYGIVLCLAVTMFTGTDMKVEAQSNFNSYTYDEWDGSVAAPASYQPVMAKNGLEIGAGHMNTPQDFFMDKDGRLYVADTGNNRILILDQDLELLDSMETVRMNGEEIPLRECMLQRSMSYMPLRHRKAVF